MKNHIILIATVCTVLILGSGLYFFLGAGAFDRHFTISGIYAVCKPKGYDAVCFLDADSKEGGLSCLPLSAVGGKCQGLIK
jgi:hypothetical protein